MTNPTTEKPDQKRLDDNEQALICVTLFSVGVAVLAYLSLNAYREGKAAGQ